MIIESARKNLLIFGFESIKMVQLKNSTTTPKTGKKFPMLENTLSYFYWAGIVQRRALTQTIWRKVYMVPVIN